MHEAARQAMDQLLEGNRRFRSGLSRPRLYTPSQIAALAEAPRPVAAVLACSDSRVSPEIVFDQPLGALFVSRVPGNVASDGAKWMLELAVSVLEVPLVLVMGHTECLAVKQVVDGQIEGPGGRLRDEVAVAVERARERAAVDLMRTAVLENARYTVERLMAESRAVATAVESGQACLKTGVYDVYSGAFEPD
jgi:carbonic anhydrase